MRRLIKEHENGFLFTLAIFTIIGLFMTGYIIIEGDTTIESIVSYVMYILLIIYVCWGFKEPHGNSLKFIGLLLACSLVFTGLTVIITAEKQTGGTVPFLDNVYTYFFLVSAIGVAYVSGRLDKYFSNTIILIICIILVTIAVTSYQSVLTYTLNYVEATQQTKLAVHLASYNPPILVATFGIAYLTRYEEHIDAGIKEDQSFK